MLQGIWNIYLFFIVCDEGEKWEEEGTNCGAGLIRG